MQYWRHSNWFNQSSPPCPELVPTPYLPHCCGTCKKRLCGNFDHRCHLAENKTISAQIITSAQTQIGFLFIYFFHRTVMWMLLEYVYGHVENVIGNSLCRLPGGASFARWQNSSVPERAMDVIYFDSTRLSALSPSIYFYSRQAIIVWGRKLDG